jgi:hypothetical protein
MPLFNRVVVCTDGGQPVDLPFALEFNRSGSAKSSVNFLDSQLDAIDAVCEQASRVLVMR